MDYAQLVKLYGATSEAHAKAHGFVSKDGDFHQRSFLLGAPPKIVWLRVGNCTTNEIELVLRSRSTEIAAFIADDATALFVIEM